MARQLDRTLVAQEADLASRVSIVPELNAHLAYIDSASRQDKFVVLQGLQDTQRGYYAYRRWGSTGTPGDYELDGPFDEQADAAAILAAVFLEKTGKEWGTLMPGDRVAAGKYWLQQDSQPDSEARWQYWVDDRVDGKPRGWHPYAEDANLVVEELYAAHVANAGEGRTESRYVQSGYFKYLLDLGRMTQQNTRTGTERVIRRVTGQHIDNMNLGISREVLNSLKRKGKRHGKASGPMSSSSTKVAEKKVAEKVKPKTTTTGVKKALKVKKAAPVKKIAKAQEAKKSHKAMKAMKATKATKATKAMKKKKVKKVSMIARGKLMRSRVLKGEKLKTYTGLKASDLMKNIYGKVVTKRQSEAGKKAFKNIEPWMKACVQARRDFCIVGFRAVKKGTAFYARAKEITSRKSTA